MKKKSCKRNNWKCICKRPKTARQRRECARRGELAAVDTYSATEGGTFQRVVGDMGPNRSQLFTWTTKVHAPSWSLPAVGPCPAVCGYEKKAVRDIKNIPKKCLGCYAYNHGKYDMDNTKQATHRRWAWFDERPEEEVVNDLITAIKVSGNEECTHKRATQNQPWSCKVTEAGRKICNREDPVKCDLKTSGYPKLFRLFDSGDFHNPRAVRVWRKVAERMPRTKFWAPTTAWVKYGLAEEKELSAELGKLARLKNVAIKPSGLLLDKPAVSVNLGGVRTQGTTVLSWTAEKKEVTCPWTDKKTKEKCKRTIRRLPAARTVKGGPVIYDEKDDATLPERIKIKNVEHYLCRGDCAKCRRCWEKDTKVAYVQHGPDAMDREESLKRAKDMIEYMSIIYPQYEDIGPEGVTEHPARRYLKWMREKKGKK